MANAAAAAGRSAGLRIGLDAVRARRRQAELDAIEAEERTRRHGREDYAMERARIEDTQDDVDRGRRHEREDYALERGRAEDAMSDEDRSRRISREDRLQTREDTLWDRQDVEWGDSRQDRSRRLAREDKADQRGDVEWRDSREDRQLRLSDDETARQRATLDWKDRRADEYNARGRQRTMERREDELWAQSQQDRARMEEMANAEGVQDLVQSLRNGGDPSYALRRFNRTGQWKIQPESFRFDPESGEVSFIDSDGDRFEGTIDELGATFGMVSSPAELIKLGKDDRLIDPTTRQDVTPAPRGGAAGGGSGAGGEGRKESTYNAETTQRNLGSAIEQNFEGQMDLLGNWSLSNADDRRKVSFLKSLGSDMEGRLRQHFMNGTITFDEAANAVLEAASDYPTETELQQRADEWRTDGWNKSHVEATAWMQAEREKAQARVRQRLAEAEQRLLGRAEQRPASPQQQRIAEPKSQDEYNALPSGTQFRAPDGSIRTKP